jgi:hypothetical protein
MLAYRNFNSVKRGGQADDRYTNSFDVSDMIVDDPQLSQSTIHECWHKYYRRVEERLALWLYGITDGFEQLGQFFEK